MGRTGKENNQLIYLLFNHSLQQLFQQDSYLFRQRVSACIFDHLPIK